MKARWERREVTAPGLVQPPANPVPATYRTGDHRVQGSIRPRSKGPVRGPPAPRPSPNHADEFMDATLDVWEMPPECATRVGHPAPFPLELPERLIDLYTYKGDLVLDPFMGSGATAVGPPAHVTSLRRLRHRRDLRGDGAGRRVAAAVDEAALAHPLDASNRASAGAQAESASCGRRASPSPPTSTARRATGVVVDLLVTDAAGEPWHVLLGGSDASVGGARPIRHRVAGDRPGGRVRAGGIPMFRCWWSPPVRCTPRQPPRSAVAGPTIVHDVVVTGSVSDLARLAMYAGGLRTSAPPGFW